MMERNYSAHLAEARCLDTLSFPRAETVQVFEARVGQAVPDGSGVDSHDVSCCFIMASHAESVRHSLTYIGSAIRFPLLAQPQRVGTRVP